MSDALVLCYHALSPSWEAALSTTPERFRRQLERLVARGYRGVGFTEAVTARGDGRLLAVTFDDAYRSILDLGRPILERLGLPATVFAPTRFIDEGQPLCWPGIERWVGGPHERELVPMTWSQLRSLADAGWEIGSHTRTHPRLTELDDAALAAELEGSRAACELALDRPCQSVAYPYGDVDSRVVAATARAGYVAGAALPHRLESRDPLEWPRIGIYHADADWRFRLKVSPGVTRLRRSGAWGTLDRARRRLRAG